MRFFFNFNFFQKLKFSFYQAFVSFKLNKVILISQKINYLIINNIKILIIFFNFFNLSMIYFIICTCMLVLKMMTL